MSTPPTDVMNTVEEDAASQSASSSSHIVDNDEVAAMQDIGDSQVALQQIGLPGESTVETGTTSSGLLISHPYRCHWNWELFGPSQCLRARVLEFVLKETYGDVSNYACFLQLYAFALLVTAFEKQKRLRDVNGKVKTHFLAVVRACHKRRKSQDQNEKDADSKVRRDIMESAWFGNPKESLLIDQFASMPEWENVKAENLGVNVLNKDLPNLLRNALAHGSFSTEYQGTTFLFWDHKNVAVVHSVPFKEFFYELFRVERAWSDSFAKWFDNLHSEYATILHCGRHGNSRGASLGNFY